MVLAGYVLEKPKLYIATTLCSYPVSLVVTIVSLYFMQVAQPALLYIVPIMMLAIVLTATCAGDLKTLWKFDLMKVRRQDDEEDDGNNSEFCDAACNDDDIDDETDDAFKSSNDDENDAVDEWEGGGAGVAT